MNLNQILDKYMGGLFGYLIVGGLATIVEWAGFWLFSEKMGIAYLLATTFEWADAIDAERAARSAIEQAGGTIDD